MSMLSKKTVRNNNLHIVSKLLHAQNTPFTTIWEGEDSPIQVQVRIPGEQDLIIIHYLANGGNKSFVGGTAGRQHSSGKTQFVNLVKTLTNNRQVEKSKLEQKRNKKYYKMKPSRVEYKGKLLLQYLDEGLSLSKAANLAELDYKLAKEMYKVAASKEINLLK